MDPSPSQLRSHPAVIAAIVLASVAVTACAIVAIAYMLGWVGARDSLSASPAAMAAPGQQVAGTAPDMGLLPGESLVTMPEPPKSAVPPPAPPQAPDAARPAPSRAGPQAAPKPAPSPANAVRIAPRPAYEERSETTYARIAPERPDVCVNCGLVFSLESRGDFWDVVVHYDDGSSQTLRYPQRPRLRAGERVHLEDGRLVPERGR